MFDIGWGELLLIGIVALIAIGPKELPTVLRSLGQWTAKLRRMASDFQNQFHEAMREAEMADLKKQVNEMSKPGAKLHQARSDRGYPARARKHAAADRISNCGQTTCDKFLRTPSRRTMRAVRRSRLRRAASPRSRLQPTIPARAMQGESRHDA